MPSMSPEPRTEMPEPLISILTPVYNTDVDVLEDCVASVLAQSYGRWQLCLVDDASPAPHVWPLLQQIATRDPRIFIAHHYIRYLGDLSGGQIIKSMLRRAYGYTDEGVRFYTFADIPKLKPFKDSYRAALDALDLAPAAEALFIAEVNDAYAFNRAVFDELGAAFGRHTP